MFSVVFVVISFIAIIGITLVIVEAHNAPLLADDEMTIAYVVSNHLGFDTSNDSFAYLASWSKESDGLENLKAQLEIVQEEASSLMKRIDKHLAKYQNLTVSKNEKLTESQKRELSKAANPFYQSLQKAKEESKQATPANEEQSKKVNRPTKQ